MYEELYEYQHNREMSVVNFTLLALSAIICSLHILVICKLTKLCLFSTGHGFKLAPIIGVILSDLLEGRNPEYPEAVREFSSARFDKIKAERTSKL